MSGARLHNPFEHAWGESDNVGKPPPLPAVGLPGAVPAEKELLPVAPETARELNAARPFTTEPIVPALPYRTRLTGDDRERAVTCLAVAALYEAGGGENDQLPVMQVILNRARHPAFPNTVCGVVFQGSERKTGCQFTFTCDGSLERWRPGAASLATARQRAAAMLDGRIDKRVGLATHYHTDEVLPYWSASLEKLTGVRTHLFFRWNGYWGERRAFRGASGASEPVIPALASFSAAHTPVPDEAMAVAEIVDPAAAADLTMAPKAEDVPVTRSITGAEIQVPLLQLAPGSGMAPGRWALNAVERCGDKPDCRVVGWSDPARAPAGLDRASLAASPPDMVYVQELRNRVRQAYWDCDKWARAGTSRCLAGPSDVVGLVYGK